MKEEYRGFYLRVMKDYSGQPMYLLGYKHAPKTSHEKVIPMELFSTMAQTSKFPVINDS